MQRSALFVVSQDTAERACACARQQIQSGMKFAHHLAARRSRVFLHGRHESGGRRFSESRHRGAPERPSLGHTVVIGGGSLGSLFAGRLGALRALEGRVWMLTSWEEHAQATHSQKSSV
jgi:tRNA G37 N-methylase TrmD